MSASLLRALSYIVRACYSIVLLQVQQLSVQLPVQPPALSTYMSDSLPGNFFC